MVNIIKGVSPWGTSPNRSIELNLNFHQIEPFQLQIQELRKSFDRIAQGEEDFGAFISDLGNRRKTSIGLEIVDRSRLL